MTNVRIAAEVVRREIEALRNMYPEVFDDEDFVADIIEGETGLFELLQMISEEVSLSERFSEAIDVRIAELKARQDRIDMSVQARRELIMRLMDDAGLPKAVLPTATISVRPAAPKALCIDENETPPEYWRTKVEPDKSAIAKALKNGTPVAGWSLSNGGQSLQIRRG